MRIFGRVTDPHTDTTIYAFRKLIPLLTNCNPNTIEMLDGREDHYLHIAPVGRGAVRPCPLILIPKSGLFLWRTMQTSSCADWITKAARLAEQTDNERGHILKTIEHASL